jgi:hypothetical protein
MNSNGKYRRILCRFLCVALAATTSATLLAQSKYHRDLPDYDQRRNALPADGGMFCVPTAYVNILRFMALNGLGNLDQGYNNTYNSITSFISNMGNRMDTDAQDGTNFSDGYDAVLDWIDDHSNQGYMHIACVSDGDWGTGTIKNWMAVGAMVRLGYGRYKKVDGEWERNGGHAISMSGYDYSGSTKYIDYANPASDDGNINAQGAFTYDKKTVKNVHYDSDDDGWVTHAQLSSGTNAKTCFIDNMHAILPLWGGWFSVPHTEVQDHIQWATIAADFYVPSGLAASTFHAVFPGAPGTAAREIEVEVPGTVKDWCFDVRDVGIYVLSDDGTITHIDLVEKESKRIASVKGARKLAVAGKKFDLFVLQDGAAQDNIVRVEPATGTQTSLKVAKGITAIEPDQETLGIAALHPGEKKIFRIDPLLRRVSPVSVDVPEGDGAVMVAVGRKGEFTLARGRTFTRATRRVVLAQAPKIRAFQAVGKDRFLLQDGSKLTMVDADGKTIPGAFDGVIASGTFRAAHSWKAFTKADISGPKWRDVPPASGDM